MLNSVNTTFSFLNIASYPGGDEIEVGVLSCGINPRNACFFVMPILHYDCCGPFLSVHERHQKYDLLPDYFTTLIGWVCLPKGFSYAKSG